MLLNRDETAAHDVRVSLRTAGGERAFPATDAQVVQYSPAEYEWLDLGPKSHPTRDLPPERLGVGGGSALRLPAMSLSVVTGR
jgi:hypothetical protein